MTGFVYLWFDTKKKRFYVGCHWGTIDDGYVCSSSWMKRAHKRRPNDFKRRIIKFASSRKEMFALEQHYLEMIKLDEIGVRYYNLKISRDVPIDTKGQKRSDETKTKLSISKMGALNPMYGKISPMRGRNHTEESLKKISENRLGKGVNPRSEETKKRMSAAQKGRTFSDETRAKMSLAAKNRRRVA